MTPEALIAQRIPLLLKFPDWQGLYHAAVLEIDRHKLLNAAYRLPRAQIFKKLEALLATSENLIECQAMFDAVGTLGFRLLKDVP